MSDSKHKATIVIGGSVLSTLGASFKGAENLMKRMGATAREVAKQQKAIGSMGSKALTENSVALRKLGIDTNDVGKATAQLAARHLQLDKQFGAMRQRGDMHIFSEIGGGMWRGALALGAAVTAVHGISFTALFELAKGSAESTKELKETSEYLGISTTALKELRYAADHAGISNEELTGSMEKLTTRMVDASFGGGEAADAIRRLHLSARMMKEVGTEESLFMIADALEEVDDKAERADLALKLFGRGNMRMVNLLKEGSAGLMKMRQELYKTGAGAPTKESIERAEKFDKVWKDLGYSVSAVKNTIGNALIPVFTDLMGRAGRWMSEHIPMFRRWANGWADWIAETAPKFVDFVQGQLIPVMQWTADAVMSVVDAFGGIEGTVTAAGIAIGLYGTAKFAIFTKEVWLATKAVHALLDAFGILSAAKVAGPIGAALLIKGDSADKSKEVQADAEKAKENKGKFKTYGDLVANEAEIVHKCRVSAEVFPFNLASMFEGVSGDDQDKAKDRLSEKFGIKKRSNWSSALKDGEAEKYISTLESFAIQKEKNGVPVQGSQSSGENDTEPTPGDISASAPVKASPFVGIQPASANGADGRTPRQFSAPAQAAPGKTEINQDVTINIQGAPGQSPAALADEIERRLKAKQKQAGRSFLFDTGNQ